ncbi:MAG: hypothetical protein SGJ04_01555 [Bacteroidota bacterium]|nr:hypothetical protein [Bacteroidota bacterium]
MQLKQVIGQQELKKSLIQMVNSGRIAHAQLFTGKSGYGTLPMALAYAQYVNCLNRNEEDSCGTCDSCFRMMKRQHPDVYYSFPLVNKGDAKPISENYYKEWREALADNPYMTYQDWMLKLQAENKQGNITALEIREIIRSLSLTPVMSGYKVIIIWHPEYMDKVGNILLKTLEEPAPKTLILLVAEKEDGLLSTITSRTQPMRIPRIDTLSIVEMLISKFGITESEAIAPAQLSDGDCNKAINYYSITEDDHTKIFIEWMRMSYSLNMGAILKWVDEMSTTGRENLRAFLDYGLHILRECLLSNQSLQELNRLLPAEKIFVEKFSIFIRPDNIEGLTKKLSDAAYHIERNGNPKIILFNLSLDINRLIKKPITA